MLYEKNILPSLPEELFRNPLSEYRATPFWAWNGRLNDNVLSDQIDMLRQMGMGGFHMHVRTGMDSPYLDRDFMDHIGFCVDKARSLGMRAWLYDEDRWPSGTAGGKVTDGHPEYAMKMLMLTVKPYDEAHPKQYGSVPGNGQMTARMENGSLLAVYDVCLNDDGTLKSYRRIDADASAEGVKWYAYVEHATDDPWFNDHPYTDTLKKEAVEAFINITHEAYAARFQDDFGKTVPAIFTDEPKVARKFPLAFASESNDVFFPWTDDLEAEYIRLYGESYMDRLPELVWEQPDGAISQTRWRFHNLVADRFADNYCGQIGRWCDAHGLLMTGHCYDEPTLKKQTDAMGDAMRCYPHFGLPGIDMLCDFHEYNTAKQAQSVVRQTGREGMMSELYGVTGWDYEFRGYKLQGDWQAALGVTVRVPHLTWMTMKGEAKRDYPASIGYQSPWWDQFAMVEDHFARLNTALTRGRAVSRVAVIHPIESYWLYYGPLEQTEVLRAQLEDQFAGLTEYLLFGQIDFDFICEATLPDLCPKGGNPLKVGQMAYDAVIVSGLRTMRRSTLERLQAFAEQGGRLIFVGELPDHVDALPCGDVRSLCDISAQVDLNRTAILNALEPLRMIDIRDRFGRRVESLLYQLREDGDARWLFIANGKNPVSPDVENAPVYRFVLTGEYRLTEYDTLTGETRPLPAAYRDGKTVFERRWYMHDSLLLRLEQGRDEAAESVIEKAVKAEPGLLLHPVEIKLNESNMLLLDMAEYAMNDGEWHPLEEILRLDNAARAELGIPLRRKEITQPYLIEPDEPKDTLHLRFIIPSEAEIPEPMLALEDAENTRIRWNGETVESVPDGWYVDKDIQTVRLPAIRKGENVLEITVPIGRRTNLEAFYLLGDFGVSVNGVLKTVTAPVRTLGFGDVTRQGLPFYTGCIDYLFETETEDSLSIRVPNFRGGLIKVFVDGEDRGNIAFSPYAVTVKDLAPGKHDVTLRLYGTRQNGFGQVHHTQGIYFYQSPNSWRSTGDLWCYEYQFKPMGILRSPEIIH